MSMFLLSIAVMVLAIIVFPLATMVLHSFSKTKQKQVQYEFMDQLIDAKPDTIIDDVESAASSCSVIDGRMQLRLRGSVRMSTGRILGYNQFMAMKQEIALKRLP